MKQLFLATKTGMMNLLPHPGILSGKTPKPLFLV